MSIRTGFAIMIGLGLAMVAFLVLALALCFPVFPAVSGGFPDPTFDVKIDRF